MMTSDELGRWEALIDREAEGEELSADERAFVESYAARHPDAAAELAVLRELGGALAAAPRSEQPGDQALIAEVFAQGQALERGRLRRMALAGGLALAAGTALWFAQPSVQPTAQLKGAPALPVAPSANMELATAALGVTIDGAAGKVHDPIHQGQRIQTKVEGACVRLDRDVRACLGPDSVARVSSLSGEVVLSLERGAVAAELGKQATGFSFSLQTGAGTVSAIGTRFGVEMARASVVLRVMDGTVEVKGDGPTYRVSAPSRVELGKRDFTPLSEDERRVADGLFTPIYGAAFEPNQPPPADLLQPARSAERATSASPAPSASAESAGDLLARARERRAGGDMKEAAKAYRRLIAEHSGSAEALTARVALGQLELSSLGDPGGALGHFSEYLRRGGPLDQEARYGQVRALGALGRAAEEKKAIETFLAKYPKAMQSAALKERLKTLSGVSGTLKE